MAVLPNSDPAFTLRAILDKNAHEIKTLIHLHRISGLVGRRGDRVGHFKMTRDRVMLEFDIPYIGTDTTQYAYRPVEQYEAFVMDIIKNAILKLVSICKDEDTVLAAVINQVVGEVKC